MEPVWQTDSAFTTLIHGDVWSNNIMVHRPEESPESAGAPEGKLIDFGNSYIMHPAYDVLYFLYTSTDRSFRRSHFDALLRSYFDTFSTYFSGGGGDDDLSYDKFKKEAEELREGVMIFSLTVRLYRVIHQVMGNVL